MTQQVSPQPLIDRLGDEAVEIIQAMREVAPRVTESVVQYVYAQSVSGLLLWAFVGVVGLVIAAFAVGFLHIHGKRAASEAKREAAYDADSSRWYSYRREYDSEYLGVACVAAFLAVLVMTFSVGGISGDLPGVIAPEGKAAARLLRIPV